MLFLFLSVFFSATTDHFVFLVTYLSSLVNEEAWLLLLSRAPRANGCLNSAVGSYRKMRRAFLWHNRLSCFELANQHYLQRIFCSWTQVA